MVLFSQLTAISLVGAVGTVGVLIAHPQPGDAVHGRLALELIRGTGALRWGRRHGEAGWRWGVERTVEP